MIIANAQISMTASHDYHESHQVNEKLNFWLTPTVNATTMEETETRWSEQVSISPQGFSLAELRSRGQSLNLSNPMDARWRVNLIVLEQLYETITGRRMNIIDPSAAAAEPAAISHGNSQILEVESIPPTVAKPLEMSSGYGVTYQRTERYQETEKMQFTAEGLIKTQDGKEFAFSASLSMSREYIEESNTNVRGGEAKKIDPLVINFDGKGAQLRQTRFNFDLDSNGSEEQLATLHSGSGFLAFDRNGDGLINNGNELFGPNSGKGFAELAQFDEDGNHFIDEGDSIYNKLRIWSLIFPRFSGHFF
ncbi:MAG: hypothetical protein ABW044_05050 [Cellvibrio sp.]